MYWLNVEHPNTASGSTNLADWEEIVKQLSASTEFAEQPIFYFVEGLREVPLQTAAKVEDGVFQLSSGNSYELAIYHFQPTTFREGSLLLEAQSPYLRFTSSTRLVYSSRYDLKTARFRVGNPVLPSAELPPFSPGKLSELASTTAIVSVFLESGAGQPTTQVGNVSRKWQFDLPMLLKARLSPLVGIGVLIGLLIALPQVATALANNQLSDDTKLALVVVALAANLLAGVAASLFLRKSV